MTAREAIVLQDAKQIEPTKRGRPVSVASKIAAETGLSYATVHRVLDPKPAAEVIPVSVRSEQDAVLALLQPEGSEVAVLCLFCFNN